MEFKSLSDYNESRRGKRRCATGTIVMAVLVLLLCSIISTITSLYLLSNMIPTVQTALSQAFVLSAAALSELYLIFHLLAARRNELVGTVRPPSQSYHAACFSTIRIAILSWAAAVISSFVAGLHASWCGYNARICNLERLDIALSLTAFVDTVLIASLLERLDLPFDTPALFRIQKGVSCRVSDFGEDYFEKSASSDGETEYEKDELIYRQEIPIPPPQRSLTRRVPAPSIPGSFPNHEPDSPSSSSESGSLSDGTTYVASGSTGGMRKPTPSSSIGCEAHRSPLSTMRSAECPDVPIHSNYRVIHISRIPNAQRPSTAPQLTLPPVPMSLNGPVLPYQNAPARPVYPRPAYLPPHPDSLPRHPHGIRVSRSESNMTVPAIPRRNIQVRSKSISRPAQELRVPGSYAGWYDDKLEAHTQKIEAAIQMRETGQAI